ncbi:MAG: hypothetical protein CVU06_04440 [Bacteroidetes bacterium HGW-Bacteroidetes-22]|nr:MAG: hypothetical protein CVU06_04440 [Bacteroidetes bacterium HGW-Bacteroidetes-22]
MLNSSLFSLRFIEGDVDQEGHNLPLYRFITPLPEQGLRPVVTLENALSEEFPHSNINGYEWISDNYEITSSTFLQKGEWFAEILLIPVRINTLTGYPELLTRFKISIDWETDKNFKMTEEVADWPENSVLSSGSWLKFNVTGRGMVKVTGADLQSAGIDLSSINPTLIRIFGSGGALLPEANSQTRDYDLPENHLFISDGGDGKFDAGDYVLFYNPGHEKWIYNSSAQRFIRTQNPYAVSSTFFVTWDGETGKRITQKTLPTTTPGANLNWFVDYFAHEANLSNLIGTGRKWFGENFNLYTDKEFSLTFVNPVIPSQAILSSSVAGRAYSSNRFYVTLDNTRILSQPIGIITSTSLEASYALERFDTCNFNLTTAQPTLKYEYSRASTSSEGWLDYFEINYRRLLSFTAPWVAFSNPTGVGTGAVTRYNISNASSALQIWDVTQPQTPQKIPLQLSGQTASFNDHADTLRTYVAFDGSGFLSGTGWQRVGNQNLHAISEVDYIIISYPGFIDQANQLADFHRNRGLTVKVTTPELIYNEFSSGNQDLSAIRDFLRMVYQRGGRGHQLRWVLMLGDASYDYLNTLEVNHNFVPTWQSTISLSPANSYATDDFFGLFDVTEGQDCNGYIDVGIGRLLAKSSEEAQSMINKIIGYQEMTNENMRDWRNVICFVADDQDSDTHVKQSDNMARMIDTTYRQMNIDKIYFDAYQQVSAPGGQRYPEVSDAINRRVENGALIINYTGHGGELGWAHERVLQISDINSWHNLDNLPFFITATCEFSRYDDPLRESAGEKVFTNPNGGGIGLFTTSRLTYSGSNESLNRAFLSVLLARTSDGYLTLGEAVLKSKQLNGSNLNGRKFILIGDPAMKLSFPEYYAEATSIEYGLTGLPADTISALDEIIIKGKITDASGTTMTNFNGEVFPTVFDKAQNITTLSNDPDSPSYTFSLQKNVLYKGQTNIANGEFEFSFIVPRDIEFRYGSGRLSLYARSAETDATGWDHDFLIGGYSKNFIQDNQPPVISLFINDQNFIDGGITDENPVLLAYLNDESGINVSGAGIGHDITAILDGQTDSPYILNDFYRADVNTYKSGMISYPLYNLSPGLHTLKVTAWDVQNNPATAIISFVVNPSGTLVIENISNYPNPFTNITNFVFEHNSQNSDLNVEIEIVNLVGQRMTVIRRTIPAGGFHTPPIEWDGRGGNGQAIAGGFYIYRIRATASDGTSTEGTGRLIKSGKVF